MATGIRATVTFTSREVCPMLNLATEADATVETAASNVDSSGRPNSVTEFSVTGEFDDFENLTELFAGGSSRWYRYERGEGVSCPCTCLGQFGIPIIRYSIRDGTLTLVFHTADFDELRTVVGDLRDEYPGMDIKRFVRSPGDEETRDSVYVDRGRLTARQMEVLQTALDMGYFERPRRTNATEVAAKLGINPSTFSEHLTTAQRKLFEDLLETGQR